MLAGPPATNLENAFSLGGQQVADLAMDPTGEYVAGVVSVDPAKVINQLTPGSQAHKDIYPCDFGPADSRSTGVGCRSGLTHTAPYGSTGTGTTQSVAYTSYVNPQGHFSPVFAVGGPSSTVSLWSGFSDSPQWETNSTKAAVSVGSIAIAPDASRVVAGILPTSTSLPGSIEVYNGVLPAGKSFLWDWTFSDSRPASMDYARSGALLAVGTAAVAQGANPGTSAVYFFHPNDATAPAKAGDIPSFDTGSAPVTSVKLSRNAEVVAAGTRDAIFFDPLFSNGTPQSPKWSHNLDGGVQRVALTLDGERFAAAAGNRIYFYRATHANTIAEQVGDPFNANASVTDISYDATGKLLVATAGSRVIGFGPDSSAPLWSFDATDPVHGGLDAPLKRVIVSDGATRFVVAGQTKIMPYRNVVSAVGRFVDAQGLTVEPGTTQHFSITVTNTGSLPDNYTFVASFPVGWTGDTPGPVALLPDQSATVPVTLNVPAGQAPGLYGLAVQVRSQVLAASGASNAALAGPALNFSLPRAVVLNVTTAEDRIPSIKPGGEQTVPVTIRNRGNAEGLVNLSTSQQLTRGSPWPLRFVQDQVRIPAGGEVTVNLIVLTSGDAASGDRNDITICAREGQPTTCRRDGSSNEALRTFTAYVDPRFGADLSSRNSTYEFGPGQIQTIFVTITNTGNTDDTFNVTSLVTPPNVLNDWRVTLDHERITIDKGGTRQIAVTVRPGVSQPRDAGLVIKALSNGSGELESSAITLSLISRPVTTTPTKSLVPGFDVSLAIAAAGMLALASSRRFRCGGRK
ncbi:MAG: NEW3 domain-containing protein [Candidatus Thermoplasmatota archaeon]